MSRSTVRIVAASEARQALTEGDFRSEIAFQNDINTLLAALEEREPAIRALARPQPAPPARARGSKARGGRLGGRRAGDRGAEPLAQGEVVVADGEPQELSKRLVPPGELA
jgi:hypothetical protein